MEAKENVRLVEFECVEEPDTQYEAGAPTNGQRSRQIMPNISHRQSQFQSFDCDAVDLAPGTKAEPRPLGRERRELEGTDLATTNEERDLLPPLKSVLDETQQIGESTQQIKAQPIKLELEENPNSRTAEMLDLLLEAQLFENRIELSKGDSIRHDE